MPPRSSLGGIQPLPPQTKDDLRIVMFHKHDEAMINLKHPGITWFEFQFVKNLWERLYGKS